MRSYWLFPSLLGVISSLLMSAPAQAGTLQSWRFSPGDNRLVFTTNEDVQPRAQLIANPTRLVIDLPGTTFGRPMASQAGSRGVREVRVGQFDAQTTRIVVELESGYTLDPQQVQVRGATPTQWSVQIPTPQRDLASVPPTAPPAVTPAPIVSGAATQLEGLRVTPDGFFIRTRGATAAIQVDRSRDRRQFTIDLPNTAVSPQLAAEQIVNRFGVDRIRITQPQTSPPVARVTLDLSDPNTNWLATVSNLGGVVIVPTGGTSNGSLAGQPAPGQSPEQLPIQPPIAPPIQQPATVQAIELNGSQLVVRADQPLTYTSGWDRATLAYRIAIPNARLADNVQPPQLPPNSPLLSVRLQQQAQTVVILLQPAARTRIGEINQPNSQTLALSLGSSQTVPVPQPIRPNPIPIAPTQPTPLPHPTTPNSRIVVVIDPGHGGSDPGAIGRGGIQEKDMTLAVARQVAALLQQQGIQAILTRSDDRDVELQPRVDIAERADATLFVSIHANAINLSRPDVNGAEVYYYGSGASQALAQTLQRTIVQDTGMFDRGVQTARFYVLRNTTMPSVLIEMGFVTGRDDAPRLSDPTFQNRMAAAIVRGILQYTQRNL